MKVSEILQKLDDDGWIQIVSGENIRQLRRHGLRTRITIAGRVEDELTDLLVESILKQAKLKREDL